MLFIEEWLELSMGFFFLFSKVNLQIVQRNKLLSKTLGGIFENLKFFKGDQYPPFLSFFILGAHKIKI
jgi:hypothetical protein